MATQENVAESDRQIWAPLIDEINSLVDALCVLDNDESECVDILAKHVERIQNAIPLEKVCMEYPKPIHRLLFIQPLKQLEIPLDVLDILVSTGFDVDEYYNDDGIMYPHRWDINKKKVTCLHLALKNHHYNAARWLVKHGADCYKRSYEDLPGSFKHEWPYITPSTMLASQRNAPLDIFSKIKTTGNVHDVSYPLYVAVEYGYAETVLHLIKLGADLNHDTLATPPLHFAIEHGRIELADLLIKHGASVTNIDNNTSRERPLHVAVKHGHTQFALSLIKREASMWKSNAQGLNPITFYVKNVSEDTRLFNDEILLKLIPVSNVDILQSICQIFEARDLSQWQPWKEHNVEVLSNMLHKLIQHLILAEPLSIAITWSSMFYNCDYEYSVEMKVNQHEIIRWKPVKSVYLCSVLLILLRCNVSAVNAKVPSSPLTKVPSSSFFDWRRPVNEALTQSHLLRAHAAVDLLNAYKEQTTTRTLQTLCMWKIRQSMYTLNDESFQSLPVPPYLQRMLMFKDIVDVLFEGYKMWPKCMLIEELM